MTTIGKMECAPGARLVDIDPAGRGKKVTMGIPQREAKARAGEVICMNKSTSRRIDQRTIL